MKRQKIIYDTFRCLSTGKKETSSDILKGIKSVLSSEKGYRDYIHKYATLVNYPTFKTPGIDCYPLLNTQSSYLIPVMSKAVKYHQTTPSKRKMKSAINENSAKLYKGINFTSNNNESSINETTTQPSFLNKYKSRISKYINLISEKNNTKKNNLFLGNKNIPRYNELFLDFFHKWSSDNKNNCNMKINMKNISNLLLYQNNNLNSNYFPYKQVSKTARINKLTKKNIPKINEKYIGLFYDENAIFNTNYEKFILSKISYMKNNKIENYQKSVESSFNDLNGKQIKLKLNSIKIIITHNTINDNKNSSETNKKSRISMYLPLSYVFLFYYNNDKDFSKKVLMSLVHFDNNYQSIIFNDYNLYSLINTIDTSSVDNERHDNDYLNSFQRGRKTGTFKYSSEVEDEDPSDIRQSKTRYKSFHIKKFMISPNTESSKLNENYNNKIVKIVHSNKILNNNKSNNDKIKKKENNNNEYFFLWENPIRSYKIKIEMPKIFFSYEGLSKKVMTFCDENLFLFLFKNNFVNWDFYVLNYILSIKMFRKVILNFFAIKDKYKNFYNRFDDLFKSKNKNKNSNEMKSNFIGDYEDDDDDEEKERENVKINSERINFDVISKKFGLKKNNDNCCIVLNHNSHKIYDQLSENNETFTFFFTDINLKNYLIHLYSYVIKINSEKINAKKHWEFYLNFKQMKYLNEVSKYETLRSFLPKIIKTNFENEQLIIDFSIFEENFNVKILSNKNNSDDENIKDEELQLQIQKPYIEIEHIVKTIHTRGNIMKHVLEMEYLQYMNKNKINNWSRRLLILVEKYIDDDIRNPERVANKLKNKNGIKNSLKMKNFLRSSSQRFTFMNKANENNSQFIAGLEKRKSKAFDV